MNKNALDKCIHADPGLIDSLKEDELDAHLLSIAHARMAAFDPDQVVSSDDFWRDFHITQEEIESAEVDFE